MDLKDIKTYLGRDWTETQQLMVDTLRSDIDLLNSTNSNLLAHAGKQLRPVLALLVARACNAGKATDDTYHFAAAAELLHNATLLHDDVADDSDERRGQPTIKALMGTSVSVLLGDYWLVKAMRLILDSPTHGAGVMKYFADTLSNLAEGELLQLEKAEKGDTDEQDYFKIIFDKTASLFKASAISAAISVGASDQVRDAVTEYAVQMGLAFQIKDDIFDYSDNVEVGKPLGVDILEQKITMPLLGALSKVDEAENKRIRSLVTDIHEHPENRDIILTFVKEHDGLGVAKAHLATCLEKAVNQLDILPDSQEKEYLVNLARFVAIRNN